MTRTKWYGIVGLAVVVAFVITGVRISQAKKIERERAMVGELKQLRTAVQIYLKANGTKPQNLAAALDAQYPFGKEIEWTVARDELKNPVDPFGTPYKYDPTSGWVASATGGYEQW